MLQELSYVLKERCLLRQAQPILVGVSGGPDSVFLLEALQESGYSIVVAHLDHGLRPESGQDAAFVQSLAEARRLPFVMQRVEATAYAQEYAQGIEESARLLRYRFLFEQATKYHVQAVAVGHTADDQVETILLHLLRGSGLSGLRGMAYHSLPNAWSQRIPLVRPLLGFWREQILEALHARNIPFVQDASNLDTRFTRNRLRHELIPMLETYNPAIKACLWRLGDLLQADYDLIEKLAQEAWKTCLKREGEGFVLLSAASFHAQPLSLKRMLLRKALQKLRPTIQDIDYAFTQRALELIERGRTSVRSDLVAGTSLELEGEHLWLKAWEADLPTQDFPQVDCQEAIFLAVPGEVRLNADWKLSAQILQDVQSTPSEFVHEDPYQAFLDLEALHIPLFIRRRQPGDRFSPLGMEGKHAKVSDVMINHKLPRRAREGWPLVISGEEIIWVPGCQIGHRARVTKTTQKVVLLKLTRGGNQVTIEA